MNKITILISIVLFAVTSCTLKKREPMLFEEGVVIEKQYNAQLEAQGVGLNSQSDLSVHTLHQNEQFIVVFKCQHNVVFSINNPLLYAKLNKSDSVIIDYYQLVDGDGAVQDYDFVDANKLKPLQ